jgi:hypothetical protein
MEYLKIFLELAEFAASIVLAVVPVVLARVYSGKFELDKTLQAAEDIAHAVKDLEEGIQQIEELRGKILSPKMKRKAEARIKRILASAPKKAAPRSKKTTSKK